LVPSLGRFGASVDVTGERNFASQIAFGVSDRRAQTTMNLVARLLVHGAPVANLLVHWDKARRCLTERRERHVEHPPGTGLPHGQNSC
jgi:hypothetical protein